MRSNSAQSARRYQSRAHAGIRRLSKVGSALAKDTEKLIRQLSLISYLMAERRPVTATEIRRDVEGYSDMTEDAFARRFYADRAELDALGHPPARRQARRRLLRAGELLARARGLPPPGDRVLGPRARRAADGADAARRRVRLRRAAAPRAAADHLGPPEPARHATRARRSASASPPRPAAASCRARLAKVDTAIYRRKRIEFEYYTMQSGETALRKVDPYHLLFEGGQCYLVGYSHERERGARVPALAHPRQGRLLDQGRARLPAPGRLRPARLREPHPVAARRPGRHGRGLGVRPDRLVRRAPVRRLRRR